jgi:hypothetical protein
MKFVFAVLGVALLSVTAAEADTTQAIGPIVALRIHHPNADQHASFHGSITVGDAIGGYAEYRWGGASCPGLLLTNDEIEKLQDGMNNPRILIEPYTKLGQGSFCLVGFTLVLRSDVGALP